LNEKLDRLGGIVKRFWVRELGDGVADCARLRHEPSSRFLGEECVVVHNAVGGKG
jgi:hypothetical protein